MRGLTDLATGNTDATIQDPVAAIQALARVPESSVVFLLDFHKFFANLQVVRAFRNILPVLRATDRHAVFVSPVAAIPIDLDKDVTAYHFALPDADAIRRAAVKIMTDNGLPGAVTDEAARAGRGLTLQEAENAAALGLVTSGTVDPAVMLTEKLAAVKRSGLMELYEPVPITEVGGLGALKRYVATRAKGFTDPRLPTPRGILLVGLPGAGKSLMAKAIASVLNMPLIRLDLAGLKGSLVGESEAKIRQALALIDAISPAVVWLDEIEKALGGVQSSARTDGGTTSAMFGYLLTWMQESKTAKYLVATANDTDDLIAISQGALLRRFDDVFFVDLPGPEERMDILSVMDRRYGTDYAPDYADRMEGFTGAEIEKAVAASLYDGIEAAIRQVRPVARQAAEAINRARAWAEQNALRANDDPAPVAARAGVRRIV